MRKRIPELSILIISSIMISGCWSYYSDEAHELFKNRSELISVSVYPVRVVAGQSAEYDSSLAALLVESLNQNSLCQASYYPAALDIPVEWGRNQARMSQTSALAFAEQVKDHAIESGYALLVELLCNPDETYVGGIQYYLSDANGLIASGALSNSHWEEWQSVQPKNRLDGYKVAIALITRVWGEQQSSNGI